MALIHAKEHLETARLLFKSGKNGPSFGNLIFAAEELGKIAIYARCIGSPSEREALWTRNSPLLTDHREKIKALGDAIEFLVNKENHGAGWSVTLTLKTECEPTAEFLSWLVDSHKDGSLHRLLHILRMDVTYSVIAHDRVFSPVRASNRLNPAVLDASISMLYSFVIGLEAMIQLLGPIHSQLSQLYQSASEEDEIASYEKLNSSLVRLLPAFLAAFQKHVARVTGLETNEKNQQQILSMIGSFREKFDFRVIAKESLELAAGDALIDEKYMPTFKG